MIFAVFDR